MNKSDKFDEIDAMFENLQKANDETVESFKERLSGVVNDTPDLVSLKKENDLKKTSVIRRPTIPDQINAKFNTRLDYFLYFIRNVNYGSSNNVTYVNGHVKALNLYLEQARINQNNLNILEASAIEEINKYSNVSKNNLETKGYYDGLNYVYKALKKSKSIMASQINEILKKELR